MTAVCNAVPCALADVQVRAATAPDPGAAGQLARHSRRSPLHASTTHADADPSHEVAWPNGKQHNLPWWRARSACG